MKKQHLSTTLVAVSLFCAGKMAAQLPTIQTPPQNVIVIKGSNAIFRVEASGAEIPTLPQISSGTLRLWLKADAGVVTSSNRVTQWQDQSPNQNHAYQSNSNLQPTFVEGAIPVSGKPAIRFDGIQTASAGDFLQGSGSVGLPAGYTSFLVYSRANRIVQEQAVAVVGVPGIYDALRSYYIRSGFTSIQNEMAFSGWGNDYGTGFSIPPDSFRIWTDRMNEAKTSLEFFDTDGVESFNQTSAISNLSAPGSGYYVGGLGGNTRNFQGDVAEVIFYQGALSDSDRMAVENYLKEKYYHASTAGGGTLTYQWQFNGTNLAGATDSTLVITNAQPENSGNYGVVVSNNFGSVTSPNALLTVSVPPSISTQPQNQQGLQGSDVSFTVIASGATPLDYQWRFNGSVISNATASTLLLTNIQASDAGIYSVRISNAVGSVESSNVSLTVESIPVIHTQPASQDAVVGENVSFNIGLETALPVLTSGTLRLWLKADSGVITNSNGLVAQWQDQSGNNNDAFQNNDDQKPRLISAATIGGRAALRFDGIQDSITGDYLRGMGDVSLPDAFTSFTVYSRSNRSVQDQVVTMIGAPLDYNSVRDFSIYGTEMGFSAWGNDYRSGFLIPPSTFRVMTQRLNTNKTQIAFFDTDGISDFAATNSTSGLLAPRSGYYVGGLASQTRNFAGEVSELIYFRGSLSDVDRLAVDSYLRQKYFGPGPNASFTYQWLFNGTNIVGATNSSFTLTNVQLSDAGVYSVIISNSAGVTTSSNALLTVHVLPTIISQPQSLEVNGGATVAFSVTASGQLPLSYQWAFNGNAISNATDSSYSISNVQPSNAGVYSVSVSDGFATVTSSNANLKVNFAPTILNHPQSKTCFTGTIVTFSVGASGYPLNFQWFFNSSNAISGATNASLTLSNLSTNEAGAYTVVVSNDLGSQSSSNALLSIIDTSKPIFDDFEPGIHADQWLAFGGTVLATNYGGYVSPTHALWFGGSGSRYAATRPINVSNGGAISFQIRLSGEVLPNWERVDLPMEAVVLEYSLNGNSWTNLGTYGTSNYWNWTAVQITLPQAAQSAGTYFRWRQLSNSGAPSDHWALDDVQILPASAAPSIFTQPQSRTVAVGSNVTLSTMVAGQAPLSYQWFFNSTALGSTNAALTLNNVQLSESGNYVVVVTNSFGSVTSAPAVVTVLAPPSISSHPQSQSAVEGNDVTFSISAVGSAPLAYEWRFNGQAIPSATNSTFLLANVQGSNAGLYSVQVSNPVGSVLSSNASLSIDSFPVIVTQPQSQSVVLESNVTFNVGLSAAFPTINSGTLRLWLKADLGVVTNSGGRVVQWQDQSGNANHASQNETNLQPLMVSSPAVGGKTVIRFNGSTDTSSGPYLKGSGDVGIPDAYTSFMVYSMAYAGNGERMPAFIGVPGNYGASRGYYVLNGEMSFTTWAYDYYSGFIIPTNTYRIWTDRFNTNRNLIEFFDSTAQTSTNISRPTSGQSAPSAGYYVGGLNASETAGRNFAGDIAELIYFRGSLTEPDRLAVENYLKQKYYQAGTSGAVTYQWQFNGTNITGATNSSLTLTNVQLENAGAYSVVVANSAGSVSSANATLTVNIPPSITAQPQSQNINAGAAATFSVTASGTSPLSYQWQKNGENLLAATNSTLVVNAAQLSDTGDYRVIVTNPFGSVTSSNASLAVNITEIRVVSTNAPSAGILTLPIDISSLGTENAVGFSLSFDPSILTFDSVEVDSGLAGALLISNTDQLAAGKLGVAVALSSDSTFAAGIHRLVQVTFHVGVTTGGLNTPITFTDSPTLRQTSDAVAETMPALFVDGTVAISPVNFEGDVAPRPNGSRTLTVVDWVQVGRFAAGLDSPTNSGEFQRADCAPRSQLGNGAISVTDWVQAGRYATGADPLTPVGGPDAPSSPDKKPIVLQADGVNRTLFLEATNQVGQTKTVSVRLVAQGDENAIGFSVAFDPALLTFVSAAKGGNATGASLNVNANSVSSGHIGVALSLSTGAKFAAGTQEVITLTFTAAPDATGSTTLSFSDSPVLREVSDPTANALPAAYTGATLALSIPGPLLTIGKSVEGISLSWPASATNFVLESSSSLGSAWTNVTTTLTTNGGNINATLPVSPEQQFYRLKQ